MPLTHRHSTTGKLPTITRAFAGVDSGLVVISKAGKTPLWSTGFAGCLGVAMSGTGPWGALAHLNQHIQNKGKDLELALSILAQFISDTTKDKIQEVFIYFGEPEDSYGRQQNTNITEVRIKELMKCKKVIDLRRKTEFWDYGSDFVYDPGLQLIYTDPGSTFTATGLAALHEQDKKKRLKLQISGFPYEKYNVSKDELPKLQPGLGQKGWAFVP